VHAEMLTLFINVGHMQMDCEEFWHFLSLKH